MTQYARPDSADGVDGTDYAGWYNSEMMEANLELEIDETSIESEGYPGYDDTDYISGDDESGETKITKFGLSNVDDPVADHDHKVHVRASRVDSAGSPSTLTVALYLSDGSTKIAELAAFQPSDNQYEYYTLTLSTTEADAISSYDNLQIWLTETPADPAGGTMNSILVSQAWFECPNVTGDADLNGGAGSAPFLIFID